MASGGKRSGAGRKTLKFGFRQFCREIINDPEVQAAIKEQAKADPFFALKVAEHGFGRPPQSLDLTVGGDQSRPLKYVATFDDGEPIAPPIAPLPTDSSLEPGPG